jgi:acetyl-CoA carboxylase carboxyltransferase component
MTLVAPFAGTVLRVEVETGDTVRAGATVVILESMKMEHVVVAATPGRIDSVAVAPGAAVQTGDVLATMTESEGPVEAAVDIGAHEAGSPDDVRPELAELLARAAATTDAGRLAATERRHAGGRRTARENIADLCDPGSFEEYGGRVIAAQRARRSLDDLVANTPADGLVAGIGRVNGDLFGAGARCAVLSYDYTVLAGTQGQMNHRKKDRLFDLVERLRLPVVLFAEGGGGRPGDTDHAAVTGLDTEAFARFGALSGRVPLVGVVSGRCFAGNAALLGCCHVIIATPDANIGMGGPAMIEGGGLGVFAPEDVGPVAVQVANGVIDVLCDDERQAVEVARRYLAYFQGDLPTWRAPDQEQLREVVPRDRRRVYDVHRAMELLADEESLLELRPSFAPGLVTALARLEGRAVGIVANNPMHQAGAIDGANADKAARFLQLCEAFGLPVVSLVDTPGFMVGPEAEETALVRHVSRMFVVGASLTVPLCAVILRKGYGLGAQAMTAGHFHRPLFTVAWPTGELGGMGLEGAVRLGFRRELDAIEDPEEREAAFSAMVERAYEHGKALNVAAHFEIDDVIDPASTRSRILHALDSAGGDGRGWGSRSGAAAWGRRPFVDTW